MMNCISRRVFSNTVQPSESSGVWCEKALLIFPMVKFHNVVYTVLALHHEERKQIFYIGHVLVFRFVMVSVFIVLKQDEGR